MAAMVGATIATVFPGFLIGAVSVQVRADFGVTESAYGWGLGGFFLAATIGSVGLGRLAQRIGPRRQVVAALVVSATIQFAIATLAQSFTAVVCLLAVAGLANAANQTGVNLLLTRAQLPRLGLAIALKQSGMPSASLLAGLAVPVLAVTVGWRWAYVLGGVIALAALANVARSTPPVPAQATVAARPVSTRRTLVLAALAGALLAFPAGTLNSWLVSSGVEVGFSEGAAGLVLGVGAASGIAVRLMFGFRLDRMSVRPFAMAAGLAAGGSIGLALLAIDSAALHVVAALVAFGSGWVWPVFTNYGIVRTNAAAAATASGITQMGVYIGVFSAPLITGWIIEHHGYSAMWLVASASMAAGAVVAAAISAEF